MRMPARIDLTDKQFGRLRVQSYAGLFKGKAYWTCQCDCGKKACVSGQLLRAGKSTSCGCYRAELMSVIKRKHGMSNTPEWHTYYRMLDRCYNAKNARFASYGGRGIEVCSDWKDSFVSFHRDMGPRPDACSLDRIDVNGHYEPGNCRWATATQQAQNKTTNINITHGDQTKCLTQWAREHEVPLLTAYSRLQRGLPFEQVFARRAP
jgi:hypothetical protein